MKYYIDQKFAVPWADYDVLADDGNVAFRVKAQVSLGHQLEIYDANGDQVGKMIEQLAAVPTYQVWEDGVHCGSIQRKLAFPKPKMVVDYKDWEISRTFMNFHFEIKDKNKKLIAKVDRGQWHLGDHYIMDVAGEEDTLTVLLLMLAVCAIREETHAAQLTSFIP